MDTLLQDLRYGLRMLARNPGFTAVAILTLAVGIGGTTAIFSFVNAVLLRPLPYPESDRLALLAPAHSDGTPTDFTAVTPGDFLDWQAQNTTFEAMAAFSGSTFSFTGTGEPERLWGARVTNRFFATVGVAPILGRTFSDVAPGAEGETAVISERLWRGRLGSDPAIIGKPITLDGKLFTIGAVMPADFTFPVDLFRFPGARAWQPPAVWTLLTPEPGYRNNAMLQVVARLKRNATFEQAQADMRAVAARIGETLPVDHRVGVRIQPLHERIVRDVRPLLTVFLGAVGFVLLIACVNVANLLLARAAARQREVAVRAALGSGRWRLVRQFLTESMLLGLLGGAAGVFVAVWGVDLALAVLPAGSLPRLQETGLDPHALLFTMVISILSGLVFGLAPAMHSSSANIVGSLKDGASTEGPRLRILDGLVVAEVALAFVLLVGAGLMVRSFLRLASVDPGFRPEHTLTLSVTLPESAYDTSERMRAFARTVVERIAATPGVVHAGVVNWLPLGGSLLSGDFIVEGIPESTRGLWGSKPAVTPDYFRAMGIPLLRGRAFSERDTADAPGVAIVTEQLARRLWPGQEAIGRRLKIGFGNPQSQPWLTVVGVVGAVRGVELGADPEPAVYVPIDQAPRPFLLRSQTFVARTAGDPIRIADAVRREIRTVDPNLPIDRIETMEKLVASSVSEPRFRSAVLTVFASAALLLVATGILGVLAYAVTRRTREIGVRMALGAQRGDVLSLVVRHALTMTMAGVALGLIASLALTRVLGRFLYEVQPSDPVSLAAAAVLLLAVALLAIYVPARRATRVEPLTALRAE
jgi:putative ABC transport system permease protein